MSEERYIEKDIKSSEQRIIQEELKRRCEELDGLYKNRQIDEMLCTVRTSEQNRVAYNEEIYKNIFFSLNKIHNQDNRYDRYIDESQEIFERALSMFIINIYYERLVKKLNEIIVLGDDEENHNVNVYSGKYNAELSRRIKAETYISIYGVEDLWAAMQEIEGLLPKDMQNRLQNVSYEDDGRIKEAHLSALYELNSQFRGVHKTLLELRGIFYKHGMNIAPTGYDNKMFLKSIRDSSSHGEYEYAGSGIVISNSFSGQTKYLKNYDQNGLSVFADRPNDSADCLFTNERLREIVKEIFSKIFKDPTLTTEEIIYYEILEKIYLSLEKKKYVQCIEALSNKEEYWMEYVLEIIYKMSLFSMIQYNTEKFWGEILKTNTSQNHMLHAVFMDSPQYEYYSINRAGYKKTSDITDENLIFDDSSTTQTEPIAINQDGKLVGVITDIKNAIGHDNVSYRGNAIICKNLYRPIANVKKIGLNSTNSFRGGGDYTNPKGAEISFKVSDWIKCMSKEDFFYALSKTRVEQETIAEEHKNRNR